MNYLVEWLVFITNLNIHMHLATTYTLGNEYNRQGFMACEVLRCTTITQKLSTHMGPCDIRALETHGVA